MVTSFNVFGFRLLIFWKCSLLLNRKWKLGYTTLEHLNTWSSSFFEATMPSWHLGFHLTFLLCSLLGAKEQKTQELYTHINCSQLTLLTGPMLSETSEPFSWIIRDTIKQINLSCTLKHISVQILFLGSPNSVLSEQHLLFLALWNVTYLT